MLYVRVHAFVSKVLACTLLQSTCLARYFNPHVRHVLGVLFLACMQPYRAGSGPIAFAAIRSWRLRRPAGRSYSHPKGAAAEALACKYTAVWQVQVDQNGTWPNHGFHHSVQFEAAWVSMAQNIHVHTDSWLTRWSVDLRRMKQRNLDSEKVRLIRPLLVANS